MNKAKKQERLEYLKSQIRIEPARTQGEVNMEEIFKVTSSIMESCLTEMLRFPILQDRSENKK